MPGKIENQRFTSLIDTLIRLNKVVILLLLSEFTVRFTCDAWTQYNE